MDAILYFFKQMNTYSGKILYINLIAMIVIGFLEGVGILLIIPMMNVSGLVELDASDTALSGFFNMFQTVPALFSLPFILTIYVVIVIGQNLIQRYITVQNAKIQHNFFRHMRIDTYQSLLHARWDFFLTKRKSDLVNIMTGEIARAGAGTYSFLEFMASFIFTLMQIGLAFLLAPNITIIVLLFGAILIYFNRRFLKRSLALGKKHYELGKDYLAGVTEQLNGIKDIKSNHLEVSRMNWFRQITQSIRDQQINYTKLATKSQLYYKIASAILIAIFIFVAFMLFQAQVGQLMLIIIIFARLWPSVAGIQHSLEQLAATIPSFQAVKSIQQESSAAQEFSPTENNSPQPLRIERGIICKNVSFRYDKTNPAYALKDINLFIPAHKMTAFVGKSGAGKSTLIDILMGLNRPEKGTIYIDDVELTGDKILPLRHSLSYVPQDPFLFHATIRENLQLVDETASEEAMWEALTFASADGFVKKLPDGLDTVIGDRGVKLSGGERQRLVLARAILRKPTVLVLDEATSALDTENEANIQKALENLNGKITIIVIAHRLSTIRNADQVVVLEEGKIIQTGKFADVSAEKQGLFKEAIVST